MPAIWTGLVATAAWTALVLLAQGCRRFLALKAFVGSYSVHTKGAGGIDVGGTVRISRKRGRLVIDWLDNKNGPVTATVTLSDRFPRSARTVYEHDVKAGWVAWGTWELELDKGGKKILVTTRYVHDEQPVEIVQGSEWRRLS